MARAGAASRLRSRTSARLAPFRWVCVRSTGTGLAATCGSPACVLPFSLGSAPVNRGDACTVVDNVALQ